MFEQTFVKAEANDKKRYTVLVSLLLQVGTLGVLILVPLIYTQVLPQARLRSVFAAPTPPTPALPKPPPTTERMTSERPPFRRSFQPVLIDPSRIQRHVVENVGTPPPDIAMGAPQGDSYLTAGIPETAQIKPPEPPHPPAVRPGASKRVRVGSMEASQLIHKVQPAYPVIAKQIGLQGVVEFTAVISKAGTIENLQLVRGHPLLVAAAREAILQWRYKPTLLSGEPVEVITNIVVNFTLNQ